MTPEFFIETALSPALKLLPGKMDSREARAEVVAICLQESRLTHRAQIGGPAHGYAQFEQGGGVRGVLMHTVTKPLIQSLLSALDYDPASDAEACWIAIEHNDILCAAFARLLLWTLPDQMPNRDSPGKGWTCYFNGWRPGKPIRESWDAFFDSAWELV